MVRYPADGYGTEMGPEARVWRTYLEESEIADKDYISDNNGTLDGILVFVSLFEWYVNGNVSLTIWHANRPLSSPLSSPLLSLRHTNRCRKILK